MKEKAKAIGAKLGFRVVVSLWFGYGKLRTNELKTKDCFFLVGGSVTLRLHAKD